MDYSRGGLYVLIQAVDLMDECCANIRAERDTKPESIEKLERKKVELNVEIHALSVRDFLVRYEQRTLFD